MIEFLVLFGPAFMAAIFLVCQRIAERGPQWVTEWRRKKPVYYPAPAYEPPPKLAKSDLMKKAREVFEEDKKAAEMLEDPDEKESALEGANRKLREKHRRIMAEE